MTLLDATATVIDAARQLPANRHLDAAIKRLEQRLELLRSRLRRRVEAATRRAAGLPTNCPLCRSLFVIAPVSGALLCKACKYLACPLCGSTKLGVGPDKEGNPLSCGNCSWIEENSGRPISRFVGFQHAPPGAGLVKGAEEKSGKR